MIKFLIHGLRRILLIRLLVCAALVVGVSAGGCKPSGNKLSSGVSSGAELGAGRSFTEMTLKESTTPVHDAGRDIRIDFGSEIEAGPAFAKISMIAQGVDSEGHPIVHHAGVRPQLAGHFMYIWYSALEPNSEYTLKIPANAILEKGTTSSAEREIIIRTSDKKPKLATAKNLDAIRKTIGSFNQNLLLKNPVVLDESSAESNTAKNASSIGAKNVSGSAGAAFLGRGASLMYRFYWTRFWDDDWDQAVFTCRCSAQTIDDIFSLFYSHHNELFGATFAPSYSMNSEGNPYRIKITRPNGDYIQQFQTAITSAAKVAIEIMASATSTADRMRRAHDWLVKNVQYDQRYYTNSVPPESHHMYGAFINKVAVCQGYAGAMNILNFFLGIESMTIQGEGKQGSSFGNKKNHMWNKVISPGRGNEFRYIDVTWDDPYNYPSTTNYYDVTASQLSVDHQWEDAYSNDPAGYIFLYNSTDINVPLTRAFAFDRLFKPANTVLAYDPNAQSIGPTQGLRSRLGYSKSEYKKKSLLCQFDATMQLDGNLVVTNYKTKKVIWATNTKVPGSRVAIQLDGNVVVFSPDGRSQWASGTTGNIATLFTILADGRLGIRTKDVSSANFDWLSPTRDPNCIDPDYPFGQPMPPPPCPTGNCLDVDDGGWEYPVVLYGMNEYLNTGSGGLNLSDPVPIPTGSSDPGVTQVDPVTSMLATNATLRSGKQLDAKGVGANCNFTARLNDDGNFVIYRGEWPPAFVPVWSTNTAGNAGSKLIMQGDGNLVLYRANGSSSWASNSQGRGGTKVVLRGNGRLDVVNAAGGVVWASNAQVSGCSEPGGIPPVPTPKPTVTPTPSAPPASGSFLPINGVLTKNKFLKVTGRGSSCGFQAIMQGDGNFVLYRGSAAIWSTRTSGNPGATLVFQGDGNIVVKRANNTVVWSATTQGKGGTKFILRGAGQLVITNAAGAIVWVSGPAVAGCSN